MAIDPLGCDISWLRLPYMQRACDCNLAAYHRWNCSTTPLWAQTMRDLDINPWTVMTLPLGERTFGVLWRRAGVTRIGRETNRSSYARLIGLGSQ